MGIRDDLQTSLAAEMDGDLADTVEAFEASRTTVSDTFDPVTGTYPETVTTYAGRWIKTEWSLEELDSQHIDLNDVKRVIPQDQTAWVPARDDTVDGLRVVQVWQDGAGATWTVQLRAT